MEDRRGGGHKNAEVGVGLRLIVRYPLSSHSLTTLPTTLSSAKDSMCLTCESWHSARRPTVSQDLTTILLSSS